MTEQEKRISENSALTVAEDVCDFYLITVRKC